MATSTGQLRFVCPGCRGSDCVSVAEGVGQVLDMPVSCSGCGARARLRGLRAHVVLMLALIAAAGVLFFAFIGKANAIHPLLAVLYVGALTAAIGAAEKVARKRLLHWELGGSDAPQDEVSLARSLARNWPYLVPPLAFGPVVHAFGGMRALPSWALALLFFGTLGAALVPIVSGRAPIGFWFIAVPIWFFGAAAALAFA